jgi:hypothetical protein
LDEPIQVTQIQVGRVEVGAGVELRQTTIAAPTPIVAADLEVTFPEPLEMPQPGSELWPQAGGPLGITMPQPPPMPVVDWAALAPPPPEIPSITGLADDKEGD